MEQWRDLSPAAAALPCATCQDDPLWHGADDDENEEAGAGELYDPGQEYLDRLALRCAGAAGHWLRIPPTNTQTRPCSLGGKAISEAAAPTLGAWIHDAQWQKRAAVFICLAQIAEGCAKVRCETHECVLPRPLGERRKTALHACVPPLQIMGSPAYLQQLANMCAMGLKDPEPHVRWAACQALGQMCTDLGPELQVRAGREGDRA